MMLTISTILLPFLFLFSAAAPTPRQVYTGVIVSPATGAALVPGQPFDFQYTSKADYGVTSYNYTVWLWTQMPDAMSASEEFGAGYFFGRFAEPNYPGNPSPPNTPPSQLVMPDFSQSPGGFGTGATDSNGEFYLAVIEEYATGDPTVGLRMNLAINEITYNSTNTSA